VGESFSAYLFEDGEAALHRIIGGGVCRHIEIVAVNCPDIVVVTGGEVSPSDIAGPDHGRHTIHLLRCRPVKDTGASVVEIVSRLVPIRGGLQPQNDRLYIREVRPVDITILGSITNGALTL
jgi:hypothetical protein